VITESEQLDFILETEQPVFSGVRRKFPRGGQFSSQSCDVTNQLQDDHSRGVRRHASGKILQNYTYKYANYT